MNTIKVIRKEEVIIQPNCYRIVYEHEKEQFVLSFGKYNKKSENEEDEIVILSETCFSVNTFKRFLFANLNAVVDFYDKTERNLIEELVEENNKDE